MMAPWQSFCVFRVWQIQLEKALECIMSRKERFLERFMAGRRRSFGAEQGSLLARSGSSFVRQLIQLEKDVGVHYGS
jgi:hypothetical protein